MNNRNGFVIAIEGLIGVGKSTLCDKLSSLFSQDFEVYREEINHKFLQLFYSQSEKYAFSFQWGMLKSRIYQLKLAQHDTKYTTFEEKKYYLWDRSMIGDYIFALLNHLLGRLSDEEMSVYENEFGGNIKNINDIPFLNNIDLFIMLNDEPSNCKDRVENLRGNESEKNIPLSYYEGLDDLHFLMFIRMLLNGRKNVFIQPWKKDLYNIDILLLKERYGYIEYGHINTPRVEYRDIKQLEKEKKSTIIYDTEKSVLLAYKKYVDNNWNDEDYGGLKSVYIPYDIMRLNPKVRGMNPHLCQKYGINIYMNEYKRIILFHLSRGQNIYFYNANI